MDYYHPVANNWRFCSAIISCLVGGRFFDAMNGLFIICDGNDGGNGNDGNVGNLFVALFALLSFLGGTIGNGHDCFFEFEIGGFGFWPWHGFNSSIFSWFEGLILDEFVLTWYWGYYYCLIFWFWWTGSWICCGWGF